LGRLFTAQLPGGSPYSKLMADLLAVLGTVLFMVLMLGLIKAMEHV
jgi:hypothetical protein